MGKITGPNPPSFRNRDRLAFAVLLILLAIPVHLAPTHFLPDDAYFYVQTAHNIAAGYGSTFSTITPTNGYHPLWMILCVAAQVLSGGDRTVAVHVTIALAQIITAAALLLFARLAGDFRDGGYAAGYRGYCWPGIALAGLFLLTGMYCTEAHLNALSVVATVWFLTRAHSGNSTRHRIALGAAAGLAVLARLDNAFLACTVCLMAAGNPFAGRAGAYLRRCTEVALPLLAVTLPYLLWNVWQTGHLMPVSGAIKSSFPAVEFSLLRLGGLGTIALAGSFAAVAVSFLRNIPPVGRIALRSIGIGSIAQIAYIILFTHGHRTWSWYYVEGILAASLAMTAVIGLLPAWGATRIIAIGASWLLILTGIQRNVCRLYDRYNDDLWPIVGDLRHRPYDLRANLGLWMREHLPPGSGVFVYNGAGSIAYFSGLRVLPADGLVNDYAYNGDIVRQGISAYLRGRGIGYYLGPVGLHRQGTDELVDIRAPLGGGFAGRLVLPDSLQIHAAQDMPDALRAGIWKLH